MSFVVPVRALIWYASPTAPRKGNNTDEMHQLAMKGKYDEALARMEKLNQETLRMLKNYHYWIASMGLLKLQRHLHRSGNLCHASINDSDQSY